jgi:hypothetical protein
MAARKLEREQTEGERVPGQVDDVDRASEGSGRQHPKFLDDVRLRKKWRKAEAHGRKGKEPKRQSIDEG